MEKIADLLTHFLLKERHSKNLDYDVYKFGVLMALEVGINLIIALFLSALFGMIGYGILFLVFFSLLRAFAGGVHLEKFWKCTTLSSIVLCGTLFVIKYVYISPILLFIFSVLIGIAIFIVGHVDDRNRKLSWDEYCAFYRKLRYILFFFVLISALSVIMNLFHLTMIVCVTMVVFHVVQIIGKNKNLRLAK